ncbi:hypothetical protein PO124_04220 [Bacillus licheniformis]|nr:hypothetical protein [Bacillus licheniformis]
MLISDEDTALSEETASLRETVETLKSQLADLTEQENGRRNKSKRHPNDCPNANITPFEMRELAKSYLESIEKGFKKEFFSVRPKRLKKNKNEKKLFLPTSKKGSSRNRLACH